MIIDFLSKYRVAVIFSMLIITITLFLLFPQLVKGYNSYSGSISSGDQFLILTLPTSPIGSVASGVEFWYGGLPNFGGIDTGGISVCGAIWFPTCYDLFINITFNMSDWFYDTGYHYMVWFTDSTTTKTYIGYHRLYAIDENNWSHSFTLDPDIFALSPASMTAITTEGNELAFGWENLDDYNTMLVGFNSRLTGLSSDYISYDIDDLVGGSTSISFDAFGIDRNGDWYFQGFASTLTPEIYAGTSFTGRYISETTGDLAFDDNYYFTFSITGYETLFVMETFEDWYAINSTRYDSPTNMFVAITGFFSPIFNKIGEFGQRIDDYFNLNEAYSSGYDFGKSIPIFGYYLEQVSYFIGNFPFIKWVFIVLMFMIGVFLFRLVLKFIPFLGGS